MNQIYSIIKDIDIDNTNYLYHGIGEDLFKFESILKYGILSEKEATKLHLNFIRNDIGINNDDKISVVKPATRSKDMLRSAFERYMLNGISFIINDINSEEIHDTYNDEAHVFNKININDIIGIMVPEEIYESKISDLKFIASNTRLENAEKIIDNTIINISQKFTNKKNKIDDLKFWIDYQKENIKNTNTYSLNSKSHIINNLQQDISIFLENEYSETLDIKSPTLKDIISYMCIKNDISLPIINTYGEIIDFTNNLTLEEDINTTYLEVI